MEIVNIIVSACITIFSLGLLIVSVLSYQKYKNSKLLFVGLVFLVFFVKGIILSFSLFYEILPNAESITYLGLFDLIILVLLFIATLKR